MPAWWLRRSLRFRLTAVAMTVLGVGLLAGALALTALLTASRVAALDDLAGARAETVAGLAAADRLPDVLPVEQPGEVVQVLDADGRVLASSASASRTLPVAPAADLDRTDASGRTLERTAYGSDPVRLVARASTLRGQPVTVVATVPLRDVRGASRALGVALLVVVPLLVLTVGTVTWWLLGRALRPVEDLRRGADQVTALGGGGTLPVPTGGDEVAALARTLNSMLDRLEAAGARQSAFVADAAHELRSPLAGLRTSVEVALAHPGAYDAEGLAGELHEDVLRLGRLVEDLLVLARVGSVPTRTDAVDLVELTRSVADGPGTPVTVSGSGSGRGDPDALRRVVRNLVDNARRHATSWVTVTVSPGRVVVDDDGPGVAAEDRERVFERFARLDPARDRDAGGSGLGLSIARETARAYGGDVVLEQAGAGGGARAVMTVPVPLSAGDVPRQEG